MSEEKEVIYADVDQNTHISTPLYNCSIPEASRAKDVTLQALYDMVPKQKLEEACKRISDLIMQNAAQGCSSCIVGNDTIEDLFSANDEEFDIELIECIVVFLKRAGYKVKYDELIYGDISNLMEIKW